MDTTNNLGDETGPVSIDTQDAFKSLLDSEHATIQSETDADAEADDVSITSEDEFEGYEEQSVEDSDDLADEADDAEVEEETNIAAIDLSDDALVNVNGEQITGRELRDGYLRRDQFTKKTQELAEHRKKWMVQEVEFHQIRSQFGEELNRLAHHVAQAFKMNDFGPEPDWEALMETHDAYDVQKARYRWEKDKAAWESEQATREAVVKQIYAHQNEMDRQNKVFADNKRQADIIEGREMLARNLPDVFGDPQKADVNLIAVADYMRDRGYDPEFIRGLTDARIIEDAYYAKLGREAAKKVQKAVAKIEAKPALTMPGTTASKKPSGTDFKNKLREAAKTGNTQSLFKHLLENE